MNRGHPGRPVHNFLTSLTNSPSETKLWGPIQVALAKANAHATALSTAAPNCNQLAELSGEMNRIALSAYLQGFLPLATDLSERQLKVLSQSACGCARISELQPWVNLARLARARQDRSALATAGEGLAHALTIAAAVDPATLPTDLAEGLGDGSVLGAAEHVLTIETAKLNWLSKDFAACEQLLAPLAPYSGAAMELTIRCMLEGKRWDEAVSLAAGRVYQFPWLRPYAAVALLHGSAADAAARVIGALGNESPLPLLRLCIALASSGWDTEARALGVRQLEVGLYERNEVASLLAASFLSGHGYQLNKPLHEEAERLALRTWHHPAVSLYEAASGFKRDSATLREASAATIAAGEKTLRAMVLQGRHAA